MTLDELAEEILRNNDLHWPNWDTEPDLLYWTTCLAGEVGELCNLTKKYDRWRRGWSGKKVDPKTFREKSELEFGDIFIYLILMSRIWGFDLRKAIRKTLVKNYRRFKWAEEETTETDG